MTSKTSSPKDEKSDLPPPLQTPKKALTILYNDLPEWMRDNHYIRTGYRPASNSYHASLLSLLHLHNESVNIHTHLLGSVLALIIGTSLYFNLRPRYEQATPEDVGVFACFFGGAMGCLGMSATYHTISNHSEEVARWGNRLDYMGIVVLIWGSFVPSIYYGFSGEPRLVRVYWTMVRWFFYGWKMVFGGNGADWIADYDDKCGNAGGGVVSQVQNERVAAGQSGDVCCYRTECDRAGHSWFADVWV